MLAFEVDRARGLLAEGAPLIAQLRGRPKLAVAAFVAGGSAALEAIEARALRRASRAAARRPRAARRGARADPVREPERRLVSTASELAAAYSHCESVTRSQAANFYYGIRLLPGERRRAMCAVYAFARRVDDIGDGTLPAEEKLRLLDGEARALAAIGLAGSAAPPAGGLEAAATRRAASRAPADDPVMVALADTQRRFSLPAGVLGELIEGVRMDVAGTSLRGVRRARRVLPPRRRSDRQGVPGDLRPARRRRRPTPAQAERLADELGVALQLTNILRDVREDAENGRVYLPGSDLRRFGTLPAAERPTQSESAAELLGVLASAAASGANGVSSEAEQRERLAALVRFEGERAREWFDRGITLTAMLDRRSAACVLAMAGIYRRLLERIEAHPQEVARRRVSLPAHEKAWVAARGMLGVRA